MGGGSEIRLAFADIFWGVDCSPLPNILLLFTAPSSVSAGMLLPWVASSCLLAGAVQPQAVALRASKQQLLRHNMKPKGWELPGD